MSKEYQFGSEKYVAMANHWLEYGDVMEKIIVDQLNDCLLSKKGWTMQEYEAFRDGLSRVAEVYQSCCIELENKNKQKETQSED
jgi:hypothetical protein